MSSDKPRLTDRSILDRSLMFPVGAGMLSVSYQFNLKKHNK